MQIKNVMHLLILCLIEHGKFLYGKNVAQTNEVRKNFSQLPEKSIRTSL